MHSLFDRWIRLDVRGLVTKIGPDVAHWLGQPPVLQDDASAESPGQAAGLPLERWLAPASAVLWSTVQWRSLCAQGRLDEAILHFTAPVDSRGDIHVVSHWRAAPGDDGSGYIGLLTEGGRRQQLLDDLRQARDSLQQMPGAVLQLLQAPGAELSFPYASGQLLALLGVTPMQAAQSAHRLLAALTPSSCTALLDALAQAEQGRARRWQVVLTAQRRPDARVELVAQRAKTTGLWHGVLTDVTQREALQRELLRRAETDALTRLPNRVALMGHVRQRLADGQPFALMFMDCDRFKQVNDSLGHDVGDELLRHLAQRLRHCLRPADSVMAVAFDDDSPAEPLAARLGGDEFVVVADGVTEPAQLATLADRLVTSLARPYRLQGMDLVASVSLGVVLADADSTAERLLRDADTAMYEAKRRGRGGWVLFEPVMQARVAAALLLEADLRQALPAGQLRPVFQPIVDIATGRITGMEVLTRWGHPQRGEVSPAEFIPVAEDCGLISALGETMLRLACQQFQAWRTQGLAVPPRISVNLSRAQLSRAELVSRIRLILGETGLPGSALQLEITESLAMADESVLGVLLALRELGIQLAIDDFGTGHSSLSTLQRFPVQQVKMDLSFVRDIESSPYHRAVVQAVVQVAEALALEVVAEGVETPGQASLLQRLGCRHAQGWLYSRALEADAVPAYLCLPAAEHVR